MRLLLCIALMLIADAPDEGLSFEPGDTCRISVFDRNLNDIDVGPWTTPKKAAEYFAWLSETRGLKVIVSFECKDTREEV